MVVQGQAVGYTSQQAGSISMKYHCCLHQLLPVWGCPEKRQKHPQAFRYLEAEKGWGGEEMYLFSVPVALCKRVGAHREKWHLHCQA